MYLFKLSVYICYTIITNDLAPVQPLFSALSQCSALHASRLPSGEESSFFGFGDSPDGPDDDEAFDDADEDGEGGEGGRVRSDFHSGGGPESRFRPY